MGRAMARIRKRPAASITKRLAASIRKRPAASIRKPAASIRKRPAVLSTLEKVALAHGSIPDTSNKRCQKNARVQWKGLRFSCDASRADELRNYMKDLYSSKSWTHKQWMEEGAEEIKRSQHYSAEQWGGWYRTQAHETHSACPASPPKKPAYGGAETPKPNGAAASIAQPAYGGEVRDGDSELPKDVGTRSIRKLPKLNGYTVFDRLGGGSYGDVYKAQFKGDDKFMAVKVQSKGKAFRTLEQNRELSLLKNLKHPNIVQLLAWRETHFNIQLMFPFYDFDMLQYMRMKGSFNGPDASTCIANLVGAVAYVHSKDILHRDIKPGNILIQSEPMAAILADFGGGRKMLPQMSVGANEQLSLDVCTRWYAAPELLLRNPVYSFPIDIWSLGITIAHMEMGRPPFEQGYDYLMMVDILKVFGTPQDGEWHGITQGGTFRGAMGCMPFPRFPPSNTYPWGNKFGPRFCSYVKQLLQLLPTQRASATMLKSSPWHFDPSSPWHFAPALAVLGPVGANAEPVAVWNGRVVVVNKLRKAASAVSSLLSTINNDGAVQAVAVTLIVVAGSMWVGYMLGKCCQSKRLSSDTSPLPPVPDVYMTREGKRYHVYEDCHTLTDVTAKKIPACSFCSSRLKKQQALKKGA